MSAAWLNIFPLSTHKADVDFGESRLLLRPIVNGAPNILVDNVQVLIVMPFLSPMHVVLLPQRRMIRLHYLLPGWLHRVLHHEFAIERGLGIEASEIFIIQPAVHFVGRVIA